MSASVAAMIKAVEPEWSIQILETLPDIAQESSWCGNNAGTGHSALCELNYTPQDDDGHINFSKAVQIAEQFQVSRQWWSHMVESGKFNDDTFIHRTPHMSFVHDEVGDKNCDFLRRRWEHMKEMPLFNTMEFTDSYEEIKEWAPLLTDGRPKGEKKLALTRIKEGTDVNFGKITRQLCNYLSANGAEVACDNEVTELERLEGRSHNWRLTVYPKDQQHYLIDAKHVFIGAGGNAILLLQKSGIPEINGYSGFPISGQFLVCRDQSAVAKHPSKIYSLAAVGAPPMSVPHMDIRYWDDEKLLLFGPFAGFSPNFTKQGSLFDLTANLNPFNLVPAAAAGAQNLDLVAYLANELSTGHGGHMKAVRDFWPNAQDGDWTLHTAGQRVQIMKGDQAKLGKIQMGTEVLVNHDRTIGGLMGASPGASVSVDIALETLQKMFPEKYANEWQPTLKSMIPGLGLKLNQDPDLHKDIFAKTSEILKIRAEDPQDKAGDNYR